MRIKQLFQEATKFGNGSLISDYESYAKWIESALEKLSDKFDEDEDRWKKFEKALADKTSANQVKVFMHMPSADVLHYNSNGLPDGGKTLELLKNFDNFKREFDKVLKDF